MEQITQLADRVYRLTYPEFSLGIGVIVGDAGIAVIDTRSHHRAGRELIADVATLSPLPVTAVINTHFHFDHSFGNAAFRQVWPEVAIYAHPGTIRMLTWHGEDTRRDGLELLTDQADEIADTTIVLPDHPVEDLTRIDLGGVSPQLRYIGRGHTDGDLVVTIPGTPVLFAGDQVEPGGIQLDELSFPMDVPGTVLRLQRLAESYPVICPGHGPVLGPDDVAATHQRAAQIAAFLGRAYDRRLSAAEALAQLPTPGDIDQFDGAIERGLAQLTGTIPPGPPVVHINYIP